MYINSYSYIRTRTNTQFIIMTRYKEVIIVLNLGLNREGGPIWDSILSRRNNLVTSGGASPDDHLFNK